MRCFFCGYKFLNRTLNVRKMMMFGGTKIA